MIVSILIVKCFNLWINRVCKEYLINDKIDEPIKQKDQNHKNTPEQHLHISNKYNQESLTEDFMNKIKDTKINLDLWQNLLKELPTL